MNQKKSPNVAMTQLHAQLHASPVPVPQVMKQEQTGNSWGCAHANAMNRIRQIDKAISRKLNSIDQDGHVPGINSLLD